MEFNRKLLKEQWLRGLHAQQFYVVSGHGDPGPNRLKSSKHIQLYGLTNSVNVAQALSLGFLNSEINLISITIEDILKLEPGYLYLSATGKKTHMITSTHPIKSMHDSVLELDQVKLAVARQEVFETAYLIYQNTAAQDFNVQQGGDISRIAWVLDGCTPLFNTVDYDLNTTHHYHPAIWLYAERLEIPAEAAYNELKMLYDGLATKYVLNLSWWQNIVEKVNMADTPNEVKKIGNICIQDLRRFNSGEEETKLNGEE